ncbi:hypothetical protein O3M35_007100 [Rhynocoris fuscipes]|uniref:Uncharacterized protein n=1 Tax=Rhynocoris fuscipes TaxID=488301 RepID=A0AAW1DDU7_9HEMI
MLFDILYTCDYTKSIDKSTTQKSFTSLSSTILLLKTYFHHKNNKTHKKLFNKKPTNTLQTKPTNQQCK